MANILRYVAALATDDASREGFRRDPLGHLRDAGLGNVTGEDVDEALAVIVDQVPPSFGEALAAATDRPPVAPGGKATATDAAIALLGWIVAHAPGAA